jgi:hypothetical protein
MAECWMLRTMATCGGEGTEPRRLPWGTSSITLATRFAARGCSGPASGSRRASRPRTRAAVSTTTATQRSAQAIHTTIASALITSSSGTPLLVRAALAGTVAFAITAFEQ